MTTMILMVGGKWAVYDSKPLFYYVVILYCCRFASTHKMRTGLPEFWLSSIEPKKLKDNLSRKASMKIREKLVSHLHLLHNVKPFHDNSIEDCIS